MSSALVADISALAALENITEHDAFETMSYPRYTKISLEDSEVDKDVLGNQLQLLNEFGTYNKMWNRSFFRVSLGSSEELPVVIKAAGQIPLQVYQPGQWLVLEAEGQGTIEVNSQNPVFSVGNRDGSEFTFTVVLDADG